MLVSSTSGCQRMWPWCGYFQLHKQFWLSIHIKTISKFLISCILSIQAPCSQWRLFFLFKQSHMLSQLSTWTMNSTMLRVEYFETNVIVTRVFFGGQIIPPSLAKDVRLRKVSTWGPHSTSRFKMCSVFRQGDKFIYSLRFEGVFQWMRLWQAEERFKGKGIQKHLASLDSA
jgi:hypothetical protein